MKKITIVTGSNRGLGLGVAKCLAEKGQTVLMTARNFDAISSCVEKMKKEFAKATLIPFKLDVSSDKDVLELKAYMHKNNFIPEILINNAGVYSDESSSGDLEKATHEIMNVVQTNTLGPYRLCQVILPMMIEEKYGRIVNVSSGMGSLEEMGKEGQGGHLAYRVSKTALNAVTRILVANLKNSDKKGLLNNIKINSVCPGWVRTEMGGPNAERSLEEGVKSILWAATIPADGPTGGYFRDGKPLPW